MPEGVLQNGVELILVLQNLGDWLVPPMRFFSFLGSEQFYILIMPAVYWLYDSSLGFRLGIVLLISLNINGILKLSFHDPRPYWMDTRLRVTLAEDSFGIPSNHAQAAVVVWGLLGIELRRWWALGVAIALIFFVGLSRMVLAVHFPTDVYIGWLLGFGVLLGFLRYETPVKAWFYRRTLERKLVVIFLLSILIILSAALVLNVIVQSGWSLPAAWLQNAQRAFPEEEALDPLTIQNLITTAGLFFGFAAGGVWIRSQGGFDAGGPLDRRLLRFLVGLIGVLIIWGGLDVLFPDGRTFLPLTLRYIRYTLTGLWISGLGPYVFLRTGLAEPKTRSTLQPKGRNTQSGI